MLFDSIKATTWNNITCIYNNIKYKILDWILVGFSKKQHLCLSFFIVVINSLLGVQFFVTISLEIFVLFFLFNFLLRCMFMQATLVLYYVYLKFFTISLFCLSVCVCNTFLSCKAFSHFILFLVQYQHKNHHYTFNFEVEKFHIFSSCFCICLVARIVKKIEIVCKWNKESMFFFFSFLNM